MILANPLFWLVIAFSIFVLFVILKYTKNFNQSLNQGIGEIESEIDQAKQLLNDAEKLLIRKREELEEVENQAAEIQATAKEEIEILKQEFKDRLAQLSTQIEKQAQEKLAKAERDAFNLIKNHAVEVAIRTTMQLLEEKYQDEAQAKTYLTSELKKIKLVS